MADTVITVEGLVKHFGSVFALSGIDFVVPAGTVLGLLGPNGAGKTTTVRILTTILEPDAGQARVLGLDVVRDAEAVRTHIGLAGQYAAVDENLTGVENLRLIGQLSHQHKKTVAVRADELLERFGLSGAARRPVRTYSGGMRRRLDVAAALVHRPPVLFLDEPTTGLDPSGRSDLWALIEQLVADGTTVLLTTQYLEEADRLADSIIVIDDGRIIAQGTSAELKASSRQHHHRGPACAMRPAPGGPSAGLLQHRAHRGHRRRPHRRPARGRGRTVRPRGRPLPGRQPACPRGGVHP